MTRSSCSSDARSTAASAFHADLEPGVRRVLCCVPQGVQWLPHGDVPVTDGTTIARRMRRHLSRQIVAMLFPPSVAFCHEQSPWAGET